MQILPVAQQNASAVATSDASSKNPTYSRDLLDFTRILGGMLEESSAEISPVLDAAPQYEQSQQSAVNTPVAAPYNDPDQDSSSDPENSAWQVVDAPYSVATSTLQTPAEATPVEEIRLTDAELADVIKNLQKQGVDEDVVRRVAELMGAPGGTPVKDVIKAVAGIKPARLTDGDLQRIASFLDRINPTGELKESVMQDLKDGRTERAFGTLTNLLSSLAKNDPDKKLTLDKDEVLSLGKALRLDDATMKKLEKIFGSKDSLPLTGKDFREALAPLETEMLKQAKDQAKAVESLAAVLKPVVDKARDRLQREAEAAGQHSRRTEQSETLIRDTVIQPGLKQTADAPQNNTEKPNAEKANGDKSDASAKNDKTEKSGTPYSTLGQNAKDKQATDENGQPKNESGKNIPDRIELKSQTKTQTGSNNESNANSRAADSAVLKQAADKSEDGKTLKKDGKQEDPIEALLRKLEVRNDEGPRTSQAVTRSTVDAQPVAPTTGLPTQTPAAQMAAQAARNAGTTSARVLSQVEQGIYSAMADGTKRLTLNLNPVELGAVSVMLSSRNGEVSAVIRPERAETAAMLTQQADVLRHSLEQQGIKVDKVDVQTPQSQNNGQNWQGMDQHNAAQEHQAQQQTMNRLRRLGTLRGSDSAATIEITGQAMRQAARTVPSSGLNLVA